MTERLDRVMFFPCSLNQSHTTVTETNGSSHSWNDGTVTMTSGSTPNSIAELCGYLSCFICHEPFVNVTLNLSFSTPVEGTRQLAGVGDSENGAFIGFDGTRFGVHFIRAGAAPVLDHADHKSMQRKWCSEHYAGRQHVHRAGGSWDVRDSDCVRHLFERVHSQCKHPRLVLL